MKSVPVAGNVPLKVYVPPAGQLGACGTYESVPITIVETKELPCPIAYMF